jgi:hypothetical protein
MWLTIAGVSGFLFIVLFIVIKTIILIKENEPHQQALYDNLASISDEMSNASSKEEARNIFFKRIATPNNELLKTLDDAKARFRNSLVADWNLSQDAVAQNERRDYVTIGSNKLGAIVSSVNDQVTSMAVFQYEILGDWQWKVRFALEEEISGNEDKPLLFDNPFGDFEWHTENYEIIEVQSGKNPLYGIKFLSGLTAFLETTELGA